MPAATDGGDRLSASGSEATGESDKSGLPLPKTLLSIAIDRLISWTGEAASLAWPALMLIIVAQVVARYAFGIGSVALEEFQWHLYAIGFMTGLAFTEVRGRNVRIDVLAERLPRRARLWIEGIGLLLLLMPLCVVIVWFAIPYAWSSFQLSEVSASPGGLPFRWLLKTLIVLAFLLLALACVSRASRVLAAFRQR
jgi:TRAP-type mannitol/chloroaromatic compound transport system permease small subunit